MYPEVYYGKASDYPGQKVPCQAVREESNFSIDWRKKVLIHATLKASDVTRFDVHWNPLPKRPEFPVIVDKPSFIFDNGAMQVRINTQTGLIDEYRVNGQKYLDKDSMRLVMTDDGYNPWGLYTRESHLKRTFQLLTPMEGTAFCGIEDRVIPSIRIIEDGEVHTVIEAVFGLSDSRAYVRYVLPKKGTFFDVEIGMNFAQKQQVVKLVMNSALPKEARFVGQVMYGRDRLATGGRETVSQKWLAVCDNENALCVLNRGSHGASLDGHELGLTLLRGAGYTASDFVMGKAYAQDRWAERMEQGMRYFQYRIMTATDDAFDIMDNVALVYNEAPYALALNPYGIGEKRGPFLTIDNESIVVSALKKAENNDGYILRLYETTGKARQGHIKIPSLGIDQSIQLEAEELKTFRIRKGEIVPETLLERY
jgi:alpha-mannosidase